LPHSRATLPKSQATRARCVSTCARRAAGNGARVFLPVYRAPPLTDRNVPPSLSSRLRFRKEGRFPIALNNAPPRLRKSPPSRRESPRSQLCKKVLPKTVPPQHPPSALDPRVPWGGSTLRNTSIDNRQSPANPCHPVSLAFCRLLTNHSLRTSTIRGQAHHFPPTFTQVQRRGVSLPRDLRATFRLLSHHFPALASHFCNLASHIREVASHFPGTFPSLPEAGVSLPRGGVSLPRGFLITSALWQQGAAKWEVTVRGLGSHCPRAEKSLPVE